MKFILFLIIMLSIAIYFGSLVGIISVITTAITAYIVTNDKDNIFKKPEL